MIYSLNKNSMDSNHPSQGIKAKVALFRSLSLIFPLNESPDFYNDNYYYVDFERENK